MARWKKDSPLGSHSFDEKPVQPGAATPIIEFTCRVCGRAFNVNDQSYQTWAIGLDDALARDTDERWRTRPCPGRPLDSDQVLRRWLKGVPVEPKDEIEIGRAIAHGKAEDLIEGFSLEATSLQWRHDFDSKGEWLAIATSGGREVVKFTHEEIADCSSESADGSDLRTRIAAKLSQAIRKLAGPKDRIGF
jgi:hypothetical protein